MTQPNKQGLQVLSNYEEILVDKIEQWLKKEKPQEHILISERFRRLRNLGGAVFDYPSIKNTQFVKDILINENKLTESLLVFSTASHLLRTPTKVVALRSFLVAKFHAFSLLAQYAEGNNDLHSQALEITFSVVFTLMAENVYFSCLDDPSFSDNTKSGLTHDLIALWDSGTDLRSVRHLMALSSLWTARDSAPPSFGTMDGNTELLRISISMDTETEWEDFLKEESTNDETRWALEEFLFGLSYEEILQVRNRLKRYGVNAISHTEVRSYLDTKPIYSVLNDHDPRAIYDFFIERRDACTLRKRVNAPGPRHTLEEVYLKYRIVLEASDL
ncbi:MAG: hypothetical protein FWB86_08775 [Treponema sp.]|nr:hypothetical protein [Treponema sp.]MCL2252468.1 hypothetical protein [Treponema sp.]